MALQDLKVFPQAGREARTGYRRARGAIAQSRSGVVAAAVYRVGIRTDNNAVEGAAAWHEQEEAIIWIVLHEPDDELLFQVQNAFDLHELAIEDGVLTICRS